MRSPCRRLSRGPGSNSTEADRNPVQRQARSLETAVQQLPGDSSKDYQHDVTTFLAWLWVEYPSRWREVVQAASPFGASKELPGRATSLLLQNVDHRDWPAERSFSGRSRKARTIRRLAGPQRSAGSI